VWNGGGGWCVGWHGGVYNVMVVVVGLCTRETRSGGVWAKTHLGSVEGVPCGTAVGDGA